MPILTPEERLGSRIASRYRLDTMLSSGGMGVIFEALDGSTGQRVAIKMLKPAYALEPDRVARFLRETRIAAALRHPNIAAVLEVGEDDSAAPFLVMELLEGRSLSEELEERGVLSIAEALAIAIPVANALAAAHAIGVIHRDVKPGNIFLARDSAGSIMPKLCDFGIAMSAADDFTTETGLVLGTPGYMAPEQAQYGECGPFTDIWGMGAVLYRCVMGHSPHGGDSVPEILRRLVRDPVLPLVVDGANKAVCATIDRALKRKPHHRYPSMERFAHALVEAARRKDEEDTADARPMFDVPTEEAAPAGPEDESFPPPLSRETRSRNLQWKRRRSRSGALAWLGVALVGAGLALYTGRYDRPGASMPVAPRSRR
jgi:serine/threonine protein kinase